MMTLKTNEDPQNTVVHPVLIVGAGLAGLACAKTLQDHGVPFLMVEAHGTVGGRVQSDGQDGFILDKGFQALNTAYEEAHHFLDLNALNLRTFYAGAVIRYNGGFHQVGDPFRDFRQFLTGLFSPIGTVKDKGLTLKLSLELKYLADDAIFQRPEQSTLDFLRAYGFSETYIQQFFKPFYGGVFLESELKTSVRKFLYTFKCFANGEVVIPQAGMQAIAHQLQASLAPEHLHLNQTVVDLSPVDLEDSTCRSIRLAEGSEIKARLVVFATPLSTTFKVFKEAVDLPQNATLNFYFSFEGDLPKGLVAKALYLNGEGIGLIQHLCFISAVSPDYAPRGKHLVSVTLKESVLQEDMSQRDAQVRHELQAWFGETVKNWVKEAEYVIPQALAQSTALYGTEASYIQTKTQDLQAKWDVFLASDALDSGSINGALRSGRITALNVLKRLNHSTSVLKKSQ